LTTVELGFLNCACVAATAHIQAQFTNQQPSTINHQSSIINHQSSIINHQSSIINPLRVATGWHHG